MKYSEWSIYFTDKINFYLGHASFLATRNALKSVVY